MYAIHSLCAVFRAVNGLVSLAHAERVNRSFNVANLITDVASHENLRYLLMKKLVSFTESHVTQRHRRRLPDTHVDPGETITSSYAAAQSENSASVVFKRCFGATTLASESECGANIKRNDMNI